MKQNIPSPILKTVKPINFLLFRTKTTVSELGQFMWVAPELFREAIANNLTITGPVHWHYFGFFGDFEKTFTLEIALPVGAVLDNYDGKFHFKRTENFLCASLMHEGNWLEIPKSYQRLTEFADANQLKSVGSNRELYINVDFTSLEANSTEIQMGIQ